MNQILTVGIAIVAGLSLSQSALAKKGGKGGHGHAAAPKAAHVIAKGGHSSGHHGHAPSGAPHSFARGGKHAHGGGAFAGNPGRHNFGTPGRHSIARGKNFSAPAPRPPASIAKAPTRRSPLIGRATPKSPALRGRNQRPAPSVAYGGQSNYNYGANRNYNRNFNPPPVTISHDWDHGHEHSWNHHRYSWRNNQWIIIDGGYGYPYGYGYNAPVYPYGNPVGYSYGLRESVQQALNQDGYQAGPPDGIIGEQSREAIAAFQSDNGLNPTGRINPPLLSALGLQ